MRVRMVSEISGLRDGKPWPGKGDEVDLPNDEAVELLNAGHAEAVEGDKPEAAVKSTSPRKR